jgi:hypothetical protein
MGVVGCYEKPAADKFFLLSPWKIGEKKPKRHKSITGGKVIDAIFFFFFSLLGFELWAITLGHFATRPSEKVRITY